MKIELQTVKQWREVNGNWSSWAGWSGTVKTLQKLESLVKDHLPKEISFDSLPVLMKEFQVTLTPTWASGNFNKVVMGDHFLVVGFDKKGIPFLGVQAARSSMHYGYFRIIEYTSTIWVHGKELVIAEEATGEYATFVTTFLTVDSLRNNILQKLYDGEIIDCGDGIKWGKIEELRKVPTTVSEITPTEKLLKLKEAVDSALENNTQFSSFPLLRLEQYNVFEDGRVTLKPQDMGDHPALVGFDFLHRAFLAVQLDRKDDTGLTRSVSIIRADREGSLYGDYDALKEDGTTEISLFNRGLEPALLKEIFDGQIYHGKTGDFALHGIENSI